MPVLIAPIPNHVGDGRGAMTDDADSSRLSELGEIMEQIKLEQSKSGWIAASDGAIHQLAMKRLAERRLARRRSSSQLNAKSGWFRGALQKVDSVYRQLKDEAADGGVIVGKGTNTIEAGGASQELAFVYSRRGSNYCTRSQGHDPATKAHLYRKDGDTDSIGAALAEIESSGCKIGNAAGLGNIEKLNNPSGRRGSMASRRGSMQNRRGSLTSVDEGIAMSDSNGVDLTLLPHSRRGSNDSILSMESTSDGLVCGWRPRRRHSITSLPSQRNAMEETSLSNSIGSNVDNACDRPEEEASGAAPLESLDDSSVTYRATYRMVNGRPSRIDCK